jgi:dolichyl-phosphate beta-glucosyltransferase
MDLSIVIPAYREAQKVRHDIEAAAAFLVGAGLEGEIFLVDDGSDDGTREAALAAEIPHGVRREVIRYEPRHGKGYAVRTGMAATQGDLAMFADSGVCIPFDNALRGIELIRSGRCEIAHGSRRHPESHIRRKATLYRRMTSWLFRRIARHYAGTPPSLTDTQCGFKIYRGDVARKLFGECTSDGFMFDVEVLLRALKHGYRVMEFPVEWQCDLDSRLRPARGAMTTFSELAAIKRAVKKK